MYKAKSLDDGKHYALKVLNSGHDSLRIQREASALAALHHPSIVHLHEVGDLSPSNILISASDHATIIDFGIGRVASDSTITALGDLAGTPRYLAPEVIKGLFPTPASDQDALALLIYEMLSGRWPFAEPPMAQQQFITNYIRTLRHCLNWCRVFRSQSITSCSTV